MTPDRDIEPQSGNRRQQPRYPAWLPGSVWLETDGVPIPVRIVDLSLGGAACEGLLPAEPAGSVKLCIEWGGIAITLNAVCSGTDDHPISPVTRLQFANLTEMQQVVLTALTAAAAAHFLEVQKRLVERGERPRRLRVVGAPDDPFSLSRPD